MTQAAAFRQALRDAFPGFVSGQEAITVDERWVESMLELVQPFASAETEVAMVASEGIPDVTYTGTAGFRKAWEGWLEGFERVRFVFEGTRDGQSRFVMFGTQIGTTRHGVEIEQPSAVVAKFTQDGKMDRIEFHLDRERALRSAGLDPESSEAASRGSGDQSSQP